MLSSSGIQGFYGPGNRKVTASETDFDHLEKHFCDKGYTKHERLYQTTFPNIKRVKKRKLSVQKKLVIKLC